jgi:hypothetical protein
VPGSYFGAGAMRSRHMRNARMLPACAISITLRATSSAFPSSRLCTRALWAIARSARPAGRIAALTLLKWHRLFLLSRTGTRVAQEKTRRGRPPRLRHNCKGYSFLPESRYIVKSFFVRGGSGHFECEKAFVIKKRLTDVSRMPTIASSRVPQQAN